VVCLTSQSSPRFGTTPMTIQIGMIGTDGVLIASDTQCTQDINGVRVHSNRSKIKISSRQDYPIAVSMAHDMNMAQTVANALISEINSPLSDQVFASIADRVWEHRMDRPVQCLIASAKPYPRLFRLHCGIGALVTECEESTTVQYAGDTMNAALFWSVRYYKPAPIMDLASLAAHLVVVAGRLNNGAIGGLEIVLCDNSGIRPLAPATIRELELKANQRDTSIGEQFNHAALVLKLPCSCF